MLPKLSYVVATTPRSGSTLLCAGLERTGLAGQPEEYFVPTLRDEFLRTGQLRILSYTQYMERAIELSTSSNGVYGMKLHAMQTPYFMRKVREHLGTRFSSLREALESEFPGIRYIFLTRTNKIAQAVSYYRAIMSNEWHVFSGDAYVVGRGGGLFNQYAIRQCLSYIEASDRYWEAYFTRHRLEPLRITYEDFVVHYAETVRAVLQYLGLPNDMPISPPVTQKMHDEVSEAFVQEFIAREKHSPVVLPPVQEIWAPF